VRTPALLVAGQRIALDQRQLPLRAGQVQVGRRRQFRHPACRAPAGGADQLAAGADQQRFLDAGALAGAVERGQLHRFRHLGQVERDGARLGGQVRQLRLECGAADRQARLERPVDADVEPRLDRSRQELHRNDVDQRARQHAHQREGHRKARHQPGAEAAGAVPPHQPHDERQHEDEQRRRDGAVDRQQQRIVAAEGRRAARRRREQEQRDAAERKRSDEGVADQRRHGPDRSGRRRRRRQPQAPRRVNAPGRVRPGHCAIRRRASSPGW
jgi:hypothetical protein